ncbi:polyribonucleotide nucleotidyltransferase [Candidatus Azambacteria bacterium RIFCSPHIGHO2_01_46_10]|uniref:Polyribonucleotide nucleotidyltransferase n=10 Tax=Candidatus Azamiibacteriota TaxID=1752741 RepID=A0A1F5C877_9BACT|nr:MAG: polyribonucleotide nucleotidyltransferase [Candidatus Azambacteria bacterium RIFCSPHIGHO2_02_46_12]OGD36136.1 MAG: polyribonucleotide nucleotidyltransferase [Candidatus Azambacteria bacterium RIFCSPHIGHO2_01_46_10]OGD39072.1 MAG: polyribonucleotide nucleotidyltransferase [Candidatus Azambacteria bacterium RIFCSPLOWO2_01_FULL_46_26]HAM95852.1 polyribonucleotide nucleotidyltransferase [Candidatus Azambacteria bacterium]
MRTFETDFGGKKLKVEIDRMAELANGAALVRLGQTAVLATAVISKKMREGIDFFPLVVDYEERFYAAGRIKGSRFMKREGRASDEAILTSRLIDRGIRPRFDQRSRNEVQIVATALSFDNENDPDIAALIATSIALSISNIPFEGPISSVRIARLNGKLAFNPTYEERNASDFEILISGTEERINMIEAGAKEAKEEDVLEAIQKGMEELKKNIQFQKEIIAQVNPKKLALVLTESDSEFEANVKEFLKDKLENAIYEKTKLLREEKTALVKEGLANFLKEKYKELPESAKNERIKAADHLFDKEIDELVHKNIILLGKRPDGRALDELREISVEIDVFERLHGSALFKRGNTQAFSTLTLGSPGDEQMIDQMEYQGKKRFIHHYNFPPFSVGEIKPMRGPSRRDIGHGALAEKALEAIIPPKEEFPYTIRVVSEILSSNGSSSMASVCGSSLALMAGGVPIKRPAAGIAMGLMMDKKGNYKVLTDIQGPEDHHGDMDLKVAGTSEGVTGLQMDVKIEGVTLQILKDAFAQAKKARLEILEKITAVISGPRTELSPFAPKIVSFKINPDKIGAVIGPGGKIINEIIEKTGAIIDIEDDGSVFITCVDAQAAQKAVEWVKNIAREAKVGEIYQGKVVKIMDFGAFVELFPGQDGMVHISELASYRVAKVEDVVKVGDIIPVKVLEVDPASGKIRLSLKQAK